MKKGALVSSIAMLLVAVIAMTTASFAWFAASLTPSVGSFDVTVTTQDALVISAEKDKNYKTTLPTSDLAAFDVNNAANTVVATKVNDLLRGTGDELTAATLGNSSIKVTASTSSSDGSFAPVASTITTANKFDMGFITVGSGNFKLRGAGDKALPYAKTILDRNIAEYSVYSAANEATVAKADGSTDMLVNPTTSSVADTKTKKYFVAFDLFFKSTLTDPAKATNIRFDVSTTAAGTNPVTPADTLISKFEVMSKKNPAPGDGSDPYKSAANQALLGSLRVAFSAGLVTTETGTAVTDAKATKITVVEPYKDTHDTVTDSGYIFDDTRNYTTEQKMIDDKEAANDDPIIFEKLLNRQVLKVRVYVYLEGNDTDCHNFALNIDNMIRSTLCFSGEAVTAA